MPARFSARLKMLAARILSSPYLVPACFVAAFAIRMLYILVLPTVPDVIDSRWYYERALGLAAGQRFAVDGRPTAYWPVGYPAFLGLIFRLFGPSIVVAKIANVMLALGGMLCAYLIARRIFVSEMVGKITVAILAFYPNQIAYAAELMSEILFLFLLLMGIYWLLRLDERQSFALLAGLVFGFATLVKSQVVLLPAVVVTLVYWQNKRSRPTMRLIPLVALAYAALGLVILPWTIRNYRVFHTFVFVADNGGLNMFLGNDPRVTTQYGLPLVPDDVGAAYNASLRQDELSADRLLLRQTVDYMRAHPLETLARLPRKAWYLWSMDVEGGRLNERDIINPTAAVRSFLYVFKIISQVYYMGIMALLLAALIYLPRWYSLAARPAVLIGLAAIVYFTCLALVFHGESRYHFPVMPLIAMYAALAVARALERLNLVQRASVVLCMPP